MDEGVISPNRPCRFVGAGVGEGISVGVRVRVGAGVGVRVRMDEVCWVQSESSASICPSLSSSNPLSQISTSVPASSQEMD